MNSRLRVQLPFVKKETGLGDVIHQVLGSQNTCQACDRRRRALNSILSFGGTQPKPRPADWLQSYQGQQVDDESLPDGG
jgi:hypothetical protein